MADDEDLVLTEVDADGVATFTLNRPERRNAWTAPMENRYFDVLAAADTDPAVRVGVLTGAGTSFCPGMDMSRLAEVAGRPVNISARRPQYAPRLFRKPLIAAINGACAGIGLTQALMCDVRFAARGARFSTAFARRGLGAEYGMSWVLPRYVGVGNALDLLLSSRVFEADEARELGLVNRVTEPGEVLAAAREYARDLARNCSPAAMAAIRHQVLADLDASFEEACRRSYAVMEVLNSGADFPEGVDSFVQKRPPAFRPLPDDLDPEKITGVLTPGARMTVVELRQCLSSGCAGRRPGEQVSARLRRCRGSARRDRRRCRRRAAEHHAALVQQVHPVGEGQGAADVLLHDEQGGAGRGDLAEELEDLVHDDRGESHRGLVDQDQLGVGEVGADQRQHLLLPAGQLSGGLAQPAPEHRKGRGGPVQRDGLLALARVQHEVLPHGQRRIDAAALGDMAKPAPGADVRAGPRDVLTS